MINLPNESAQMKRSEKLQKIKCCKISHVVPCELRADFSDLFDWPFNVLVPIARIYAQDHLHGCFALLHAWIIKRHLTLYSRHVWRRRVTLTVQFKGISLEWHWLQCSFLLHVVYFFLSFLLRMTSGSVLIFLQNGIEMLKESQLFYFIFAFPFAFWHLEMTN